MIVVLVVFIALFGIKFVAGNYGRNEYYGMVFKSNDISYGDFVYIGSLKHVIGEPGDMLTYDDGHLQRNGEELEERINMNPTVLQEYCLSDEVSVEMIPPGDFMKFIPLNDSVGKMILLTALVVIVICFVLR
mgnify:CR=1 FL=1